MVDQQNPSLQGQDGDNPNPEEDYPIDPEFWDNLLDLFPSWGDEIIALLLILFGILSFLSIFNVFGESPIPTAWATTLTTLFGHGSMIVSGGILLLGIVIVLVNIGVGITFPTRRIIALEAVFIASVALLHLVQSQGLVSEMRPLARAGRGGGLVGWALSYPPTQLISYTSTVAFYSVILIVGIGVTLGIRREQIKRAVLFIQNRFDAAAAQLAYSPKERRKRRSAQRQRRDEAARLRALQLESPNLVLRSPIMRIRPDMDRIPPSMRPGADVAPVEPEVDELIEHPLFTGEARHEIYDIIGEVVEDDDEQKATPSSKSSSKKKSKKSDKAAEKKVKRPDGRVKRYFSLGDMDEAKKVGKRDEAWPDLDLLLDIPLNRPEEVEINTKVVLIENTLLEFDIDIDVQDVKVGPTVTQYLVKPFRADESDRTKRTRISKIASYQNDLALALSAKRLRIEAPVPGTSFVGIEVPNNDPSTVSLRSVYESEVFQAKLEKSKTPLLIPLGRDVAGDPFPVDLASLPHTLVAGTTGSGKSVALAAITTALLLNNTPDDLRFVMLDPKMVELSRFNGLPHLMGPVETDTERIMGVLRWCTREMDNRYQLLEKESARNIAIYNDKMAKRKDGEKLPYIVILIDEVGDLMMSNPDETEHNLTRLAQMARAVGMHMVVATQRPSVDVLTGLIKANFPGRIAFSVASGVDSRVILDSIGAEALLGKGDMLFLSNDAAGPKRLQGCFVSDDEVRRIVDYWKGWARDLRLKGEGLDEIRRVPWEKTLSKLELLSETDELLEDALKAVIQSQTASTAMLQKHLNVGFPRASRIMDLLHELGAIGPPQPGGKMRKVLISSYRKDPMKELIDERRRQERERQRAEERAAKAAAEATAGVKEKQPEPEQQALSLIVPDQPAPPTVKVEESAKSKSALPSGATTKKSETVEAEIIEEDDTDGADDDVIEAEVEVIDDGADDISADKSDSAEAEDAEATEADEPIPEPEASAEDVEAEASAADEVLSDDSEEGADELEYVDDDDEEWTEDDEEWVEDDEDFIDPDEDDRLL